MNLNQNVNVQLTQKLTLSPELLQSLEIMQLPLVELIDKINEELEINPALEVDETSAEQPRETKDIDSIEDTFFGEQDFFMDSSSAAIDTGYSSETSESDQQNSFLEGAISSKTTLKEYLTDQLEAINYSDKEMEIGLSIISDITPDGFYPFRIKDIFPKNEQKLASDILDRIQMFDPPGIASYNVQEALLFQLESSPQRKLNRNAYIIVKQYFDLLCQRKDTVLARELGISPDAVKRAIKFISKFNPYPGRIFSSDETLYITPDVYVRVKDGELNVEINDSMIPPLIVSKTYERMLEQSKKNKANKEESKFLSEKVFKAKQFIGNIKYRNTSLYKLTMCLVNEQKQFFYMGPKYLKPFTMTQASEAIGLSESTVSRLAASKYIQTEWGLKPVKYFFTNAANKNTTSDHSSEYVRQLIKEIIEADEKGTISDQAITDALKNKGVNISRRTVNKYRNQMDIQASHKRNI